MVCIGFKAPDEIDNKFFDPKYVFEDISGAKAQGDQLVDAAKQITSLKKLLDKKRPNRSGYADEALEKTVLYEEADLIDFLDSQDPYSYLTKFNKVSKMTDTLK